MDNIKFYFKEIAKDTREFANHAQKFLDQPSRARLIGAADSLEGLNLSLRHRNQIWELPLTECVQTRVSKGECESSKGKSKLNLFALMSFQWMITRVTEGKKSDQKFEIVNASTRVRFYDEKDELDPHSVTAIPKAEWNFDIGDATHPGTRFHSQVNWALSSNNAKGHLPVPRLPSTILTPSEVLDFTLGELFQERWPKHSQGGDFKAWMGNHRDRMERLLHEQLSQIRNEDGASPIQALKAWIPPSDSLNP